MSRITTANILQMKKEQRRIAMLTCYDATFAQLIDTYTDVDALLIGDSLGMVIKGDSNTLGATIDDLIYHTKAVSRHTKRVHIVADMPFLSYQTNDDDAVRNAGALMRAGAHAIKIEGGVRIQSLVRRLVDIGIPVMGHVGLMGQSIHAHGGHLVQGKTQDSRKQILDDAKALQDAGAYAVLVECMVPSLAKEITASLTVPTIGIGAGVDCDGQVLVLYDLLNLNPEFKPRFVKSYMNGADLISKACKEYVHDVKSGVFPGPENTYREANS